MLIALTLVGLLGASWYRNARLTRELEETRRENRLLNEVADTLAKDIQREKVERARWETAYASTLPRETQ